ncbi:MAG TPA: hypothetical protein VNU44_10635 [Bryobacteraceae bacterium]|jgi:hypothetical protein|nr:hypothetical protein [Bryobacteraceae bacterium]
MRAIIALVSLASLAWAQKGLAEEVSRVASLDGVSQTKALQILLTDRSSEDGLTDLVFYHEGRLRGSLQDLLSDSTVGDAARRYAAIIGDPDDLRLMVRLGPATERRAFENRWAYGVACALLEPESDQEWAFLRKAAFNDFEDRWVDAGAIQTRKLIASPRSRQILEEAQKANASRANLIARALAYIQTNPAPLADQDLEKLAKRVAQAVTIGKWEGNGRPRYNQTRDRALVDISFRLPEDALTYTATFQHVEGVWKLRGVRETLQAFILSAPISPARRPL